MWPRRRQCLIVCGRSQDNRRTIVTTGFIKYPRRLVTPGKYHPACVPIWKAWLNFVQVFLDKQTNNVSVLHLVPLLLPWDAPHDSSVIGLLMHYMPTQLTNLVKGDLHPASAEHSDGSLRSNCWELVCQSVGNELYKIRGVKMNLSPWVHPCDGKRTDIFSTEDSLEIWSLTRFFSCQSSTMLQELTFVCKQSRNK